MLWERKALVATFMSGMFLVDLVKGTKIKICNTAGYYTSSQAICLLGDILITKLDWQQFVTFDIRRRKRLRQFWLKGPLLHVKKFRGSKALILCENGMYLFDKSVLKPVEAEKKEWFVSF